MAIRVIDDTKLNDIAVAIQQKSSMAEQMTVDEMPQRIADIRTTVDKNASLILMDWEGTVLKSYSKEEALALDDLPENSGVEHDMLLFQSWNYSIDKVKEYISKYPNRQLIVGAIYTTTDGEDHYYFNNPRLTNQKFASVVKRATKIVNNLIFQNYYSLKNISIPDGVKVIGNAVFDNCRSLENINIPNGVESISNSFRGCSSLKTISIPDSVTKIGNTAFYGCSSLTNINIPDGIKSIDGYTFYNCYSLTSINIPDGVEKIGFVSFLNCYSLTSINIPNSVMSIDEQAFFNCIALCDVILMGKTELLNPNGFGGNSTELKFYVHQSDLEWYTTATNWSAYYEQGKITSIEDNIDYLVSLGYDRDELLEV